MLARKMKKTTTPKQFELLVSYLQNHYDLAVGFANSAEANKRRQQMWIRLTDKLNRIGPPARNCTEWKSIWSDYKYNLKRKLSADLKLAKRKNCNKRLPFNRTEQTAINLLGLKDKLVTSNKSERKTDVVSVADDPVVAAVPELLMANSFLPQYNLVESDAEIEDDKQGILINNDLDSTRVPIIEFEESPPTEQEYNVETAICDVNVSAMVNDTLMAMQKTQLAILNELKESNRNKRNTYELKSRLLQLEQEKLDEKKLQNYEENKQAYIKIELKRKELELYELKLKGLCTQCALKKESD